MKGYCNKFTSISTFKNEANVLIEGFLSNLQLIQPDPTKAQPNPVTFLIFDWDYILYLSADLWAKNKQPTIIMSRWTWTQTLTHFFEMIFLFQNCYNL